MRVLAAQPIKFVCILPKKRATKKDRDAQRVRVREREREWRRTAKNKGGAENGGTV